MTDQTASADSSVEGPSGGPDYEMPDALALQDPAQYRALFEETRQAIVSLLRDRAATITELAEVLDKPKGTVGHHMQVLADAGLVRVVRTEKVRALHAKYWGRTARVFFYDRIDAASGDGQRKLQQAAAEVASAEAAARAAAEAGEELRVVLDVNRRDMQVPAERAREFQHRLADLLLEFADEPRGGEATYAVVYGIFPSQQRRLPATEESS